MKAIVFAVSMDLNLSPEAICRGIFDLDRWPDFTGYGILPGIRNAEFLTRPEGLVGTRIAVTNTDGSTHVEEVMSWDGSKRLVMRLAEFSPPLNRLASHFEEHWHFEPHKQGQTRVTREFHLYPLNPGGGIALRLIAPLLRRAASRHLAGMAEVPA